jgi:hypothetical protein
MRELVTDSRRCGCVELAGGGSGGGRDDLTRGGGDDTGRGATSDFAPSGFDGRTSGASDDGAGSSSGRATNVRDGPDQTGDFGPWRLTAALGRVSRIELFDARASVGGPSSGSASSSGSTSSHDESEGGMTGTREATSPRPISERSRSEA